MTNTKKEKFTIPLIRGNCVNELLPLIADDYKVFDKINNGEQTKIKTGYVNGKFFCQVSIKQL